MSLFFGTPEGVSEGQCFRNRKELIASNLHRFTIHGIDGNGKEGACAIVLSDGYEDDLDFGDEIIYTGQGGNDSSTKKQIAHQDWNSPGNKGLVISMKNDLPVRVIRGYKHKSVFSPKSGYKYAGLYRVVDCWEEIGKSGFKICRFKLIKEDIVNGNTDFLVKNGALVLLYLVHSGTEKWFSIGAEPPNDRTQKLSSESRMAQLLLDKKEGDDIDFGQGYKILEIKRYLST